MKKTLFWSILVLLLMYLSVNVFGAGLVGDVNGDGKVTVFDAQLLLEHDLGLRALMEEQQAAAADLTAEDIVEQILYGNNLVAPEKIPATMTKQNYRGLNYWLYTPEDPAENMPLVVYLHGGSGKGDDLELITGVDGFPQYLRDGRIVCEAYVIIPQCPSDQKGWKTMTNSVETLIDYTCTAYRLDSGKVSLTGHSMGGTGVWSMALSKPELFYKIAPMSGSVTLNDQNVETLSKIPVWAFVGEKDTVVAPDSTIDMVEALQLAHGDASVTILEGADHFAVPSLAYLESTVIDWLID